MSNQECGVDQLIQRLKSEALTKVQSEKIDILQKAKDESQKIIREAEQKAESILLKAHAEVTKEREALASELELAARDFSIILAERLREQLYFPIVKSNVRATLKEPDFLKKVLEKLVVDYLKENPTSLDVLVPKELKTTLAAFFAGAVFDSLEKNCDIRLKDQDGLEGFVLVKKGEHYVWDFRVETIASELMRLVEPSLRKYFSVAKKTKQTANTQEHAMA